MILSKHRPFLRHRKKVRPFDKLRANGSCSLHGVPNTALKRRFEPTLEGALGRRADLGLGDRTIFEQDHRRDAAHARSEEHTSELQSLMRISYAVFCLKKKNQ